MTYFGPEQDGDLAYASKKGNIPKEVKSVMNYRDIPYRKKWPHREHQTGNWT